MNDQRYFGLTPTQLNLAFFAVVGAVAAAGFVYFGGVGAVREYLGEEEPVVAQGDFADNIPEGWTPNGVAVENCYATSMRVIYDGERAVCIEPGSNYRAEPTPESEPIEEPIAPVEEPAPQPPCTQFSVLCEARVVNTGSTGLNVRDAPSINGRANEYLQLHDGAAIVIEGGPVQADGYTWWQMWGDLGWVAEGDGTTKWLIPAEEESSCPIGMNGCGEPD